MADDNISEIAPTLKVRYADRTDRYGMKFRKGFRQGFMVTGQRPRTRAIKRAIRPR